MANSRSSPTRGELLDRAFLSAMRCRWRYRGYESREKAIASLRRRCPGFSARQIANAIRKGTDLYDRALAVVKANEDLVVPAYVNGAGNPPRKIVEHVRKLVPGFRQATYKQAIAWVIYWHYLR